MKFDMKKDGRRILVIVFASAGQAGCTLVELPDLPF